MLYPKLEDTYSDYCFSNTKNRDCIKSTAIFSETANSSIRTTLVCSFIQLKMSADTTVGIIIVIIIVFDYLEASSLKI